MTDHRSRITDYALLPKGIFEKRKTALISGIRNKIKANNTLTAETVDTCSKQTYPILFYPILCH